MSLPVPVSISPSRVSKFADCAQAFKFRAIDRLPEPGSPAMELGNIIHNALFHLYYDFDAGERTPGRLVQAMDETTIWPDYADDKFIESAYAIANNVFQVEDPNVVVPMGVELRLDWPMAGHRAIGIIDRLDVTPQGDLIVVDYKTGKVPKPRDEATKLQGVMFYARMIEHMLGVRPIQVKLIYLSKPVVITATPSDQVLRGLDMRLEAMWGAIETACEHESFRPKVGPLCSWCSYQAICPAWRD